MRKGPRRERIEQTSSISDMGRKSPLARPRRRPPPNGRVAPFAVIRLGAVFGRLAEIAGRWPRLYSLHDLLLKTRDAPMRRALILLCALMLDASLLERAWAAQACAWIVESVEDDGAHMFRLNLSVDAPTSVSVRFKGPGFTSASMGGDMIQLDSGVPKDIDADGFDVSAGDDIHFDVELFDHPLTSLDEMDNPTGKLLAAFAFNAKVGRDDRASPANLAKQCKPLG
jgi:hypothetical protein